MFLIQNMRIVNNKKRDVFFPGEVDDSYFASFMPTPRDLGLKHGSQFIFFVLLKISNSQASKVILFGNELF